MPGRLLIAGTACATMAAVTIGVLLALAGDDRAPSIGVTAPSSSAPSSWQTNAGQWPRALQPSAPTDTPAQEPSAAPVEAQVPPPPVVAAPIDEPPAAAPQYEPPPPPTPTPPVEWLDVDFAARVLAKINEEREARGAPAMVVNNSLALSAENYSHTLTYLNTLDHAADGSDLLARVQSTGFYDVVQVGEVLWYGTGNTSAASVVIAWLNSPAHHDIILDPVYRQVGAGCYVREADQREARCVVVVAG